MKVTKTKAFSFTYNVHTDREEYFRVEANSAKEAIELAVEFILSNLPEDFDGCFGLGMFRGKLIKVISN
jgi:hypothetical protein